MTEPADLFILIRKNVAFELREHCLQGKMFSIILLEMPSSKNHHSGKTGPKAHRVQDSVDFLNHIM